MSKVGIAIAVVLTLIPYSASSQPLSRSVVHKTGHSHVTSTRLLQRDDGLTIIAVALKQRPRLDGYDCSHMVHAIYKEAGFPYKYATAAQLYAGVGEFRRVQYPQPGDLVTFPDRGRNGHVGVMVSPRQRLFFSALTHGPSVSSYVSSYWRRRGTPHFFRYVRTVPVRTRTALLQ